MNREEQRRIIHRFRRWPQIGLFCLCYLRDRRHLWMPFLDFFSAVSVVNSWSFDEDTRGKWPGIAGAPPDSGRECGTEGRRQLPRLHHGGDEPFRRFRSFRRHTSHDGFQGSELARGGVRGADLPLVPSGQSPLRGLRQGTYQFNPGGGENPEPRRQRAGRSGKRCREFLILEKGPSHGLRNPEAGIKRMCAIFSTINQLIPTAMNWRLRCGRGRTRADRVQARPLLRSLTHENIMPGAPGD